MPCGMAKKIFFLSLKIWTLSHELMLKLKLQYFGHLMRRGPDAGRDWGQEEKGTTEDENGWMASPTRWV